MIQASNKVTMLPVTTIGAPCGKVRNIPIKVSGGDNGGRKDIDKFEKDAKGKGQSATVKL